MADLINKVVTLEGLDCKKCILEITNKAEIDNKDINVENKKLTLKFRVSDNDEYTRKLEVINKILKTHKHEIDIYSSLDEQVNKSLYIGKLSCASCAAKIESNVRKIDGVKSADIDFVNSVLKIEVTSKGSMDSAVEETISIIKAIEPGSYVRDLDTDNVTNVDDNRVVQKTMLTLILGSIPFILGMFLNVDTIYQLGLFVVSYVIIGKTVIFKAIRNILRGDLFDENSLMMIATIGAFIIGEYHEAVAVMAFYLVGEMFQDMAVDKSRRSITELMDIKSEFANILVNGEVKRVKPEDVEVGSLVIVKPGEKFPLDGVVVEGEGYVDTSSITGESMPRYVELNSDIYSGFINTEKAIVIKTTKAYVDSTVNKIFELIENASSKKAPTEKFITKFSRIYTPIVVGIAIIIAIIPPLLFNGEFNTWIYRALAFLVVSCPCALVISVPLGFYGGIGFASKNGILVKGGNFLEALKNSNEFVFDKTGTLTTGEFVISEVNPVGLTKNEILEIAAASEYYSIHPIANAIKNEYKEKIDISKIEEYREISGLGISVKIDGISVLIGNARLLNKFNIKYSENIKVGTVLYIAINGSYAGNILIVDKIKEEAKYTINSLKALGVEKISMLTGDKQIVADSVARNLGIDEVHSEVLPAEKVEILENKVKNNSKKVVYIGDGINDAPVLAISDVGISMGMVGSDAAIEASDIVIMNDDLSKIADALEISKETSKVVWQNIIFAIFIKVLVLVLAAFGIVSMWIAVFADVGVSLIAILNATRILRMKLKENKS